MVLGGDLNLGIDVMIDRHGAGTNNEKAAKWLENHMCNNNYVDVWRYVHPDKNGFTWRRLKPSPSYSRPDYSLVSDPFMQFVDRVNVIPGYQTDHSSVVMNVIFQHQQKGPGYWKLNNSLLKDIDYVNKINNLIAIELDDVKEGQYRKKWELFKLVVRGTTLQHSARKQKSNRNKIAALERKLKKLQDELIDKNMLFDDTKEQIRLVKSEIMQIKKEKVKGAIIRSKAAWEFLGDRGTKYFLGLEKRNYTNKTLYQLI